MVAVYNSFEAGTDTATITTLNTNAAGDTPFEFITIGSTATATFDTTHSRGNLSAKLNAGTTPGDVGFEWSTSVGSLSTWYLRMYYYATSHPVIQHRILDSVTSGGAALCSAIFHQAAGTICTADGGFNIASQGSVAVPLNKWVRFEMKVIGSATTGQIISRMFNGDAANPIETLTSSATTNTSGSAAIHRFGLHGDTYDVSRTFWLDDLGVSSVDWMGPATWQKVGITGSARPTPGVLGQAVSRAATW